MFQPKSSDYIPYHEREGWQDVIGIEQDDGPNPVAAIAYSFEYKDAMDTFRALSAAKEYSERAYELTETIIMMNPSHYTIWFYRQEIIKTLNLDLQKELDFLVRLVEENPKCYQLWQHRQFVVSRLEDPSQEDEFLDLVLEDDSKNFHAWSYRQWLVRHFNLFDNELEYTLRYINLDARNNSAWNQRFFALTASPKSLDVNGIDSETRFVVEWIKQMPFNEAPWNYLFAIYEHVFPQEYPEKLLNVLNERLEGVKSRFAFGWRVEIAKSALAMGKLDKNNMKKLGEEACNKLITMDIVRTNYWKFRLEYFERI